MVGDVRIGQQDLWSVRRSCDSAGASHGLLVAVVARWLCFSVGFDLTEKVRAVCLAVPEHAWRSALDSTGELREGAWVAELDLELSAWPVGSGAICRRERPHPGAQLSFSDAGGHRFQVALTNQTGSRSAPRAAAPPARRNRRRDPLWQGERAAQPALPRLRHERRLAGTGALRL